MISDEYFYNLSQPLLDDTENLSIRILRRIRQIALALVAGKSINIESEQRQIENQWQEWDEDAESWVDNNLPDAYRQGLSEADKVFSGAVAAGSFLPVPMFGGSFSQNISEAAKKKLSDLPNHLAMYGVFQDQAYNDLAKSRIPVIRDATDTIRDLVILSSDQAYTSGDALTRRQLSEEIMRPLANRGITGVRYTDGRTMRLESYAEMVARTQTGNASRQANLNRIQEYGGDLVLISQHYPTSDLCAPYQGRVFSISGTDNNFPPLDRAIAGGLYHPNCKHSQAGYKRGDRIPDAREKVDSAENKKRYEAQNQQRYNERQIRAWKRRQEVAMTDDSRRKASAKVKEWQSKQREHIKNNSYLKRNYNREQIS